MVYKKTRNEIEEVVNGLGYELLMEYFYENSFKRRVVVKDKDGYKYDRSFNGLKHYKKIRMIADNLNPFSLENISLWLRLNNKNFILTDNKYVNSIKKLKFHCLKSDCDSDFYMSWNNLKNGNQNCPVCNGSQIGKYNSLAYLRPDLIYEWDVSNLLKPKDVTVASHIYVMWKCSVCENKWKSRIKNRTLNGSGCPLCNQSKGEKEIKNILSSYLVMFYIQYKEFKDCKDKAVLPFDFYLPDYNLLIEYNGRQHYEIVDFKGKGKVFAEIEFKKLKKHDRIKKKYCKNNNIKLIIISHKKFNQIENILKKELKLC